LRVLLNAPGNPSTPRSATNCLPFISHVASTSSRRARARRRHQPRFGPRLWCGCTSRAGAPLARFVGDAPALTASAVPRRPSPPARSARGGHLGW
jgi:hypothetical protein